MTMDQFLLLAFAILVFLAAVVFFVVLPARRKRLIEIPPPARATPSPAPSPPPDAQAELVVPPADGPPDDLRQMKGVGPKLAARLNELGITRFAQLAALDAAQMAALDSRLEQFQGRPARDRWQEQAALLARGDREGFEALMGRLGNSG